LFKPAGVPARELEQVVMTLDEFEAVRLAGLEGLYHQQAGERMGVSRATFGRILDGAWHKLAEVLVHGKALRIEGGPVRVVRPRGRGRCRHPWHAEPAPTRGAGGAEQTPRKEPQK
jgi:predicted DNA-binding protein (UPF0251 family)